MPFTNELTGASGSYAVGGQTINYTAVATGGNLDSYGAGYGDIDSSNYWLGNGSESPETYTYGFDQTISGLEIKVNAQNTTEVIDFTINGVDVSLNDLIASGDVTIVAAGNGTVDVNGNLVGDDANVNNNNSTILQFNMPIDTIALAHSTVGSDGNGSLIELRGSDQEYTVVCFAAGTMIMTPTGERVIEDLECGDLVVTLDRGPQPVRWIASSAIGNGMGPLAENVVPVRIKPRALGNPTALIVSPQHCILMRNARTDQNVFVRAKHLAQETKLASFARGRKRVIYYHLMLEQHQIVIANNVPSESFYPGPQALKALSPMNRLKLCAVQPGLADDPIEKAYGARAAEMLPRGKLRKLIAGQLLESAPVLAQFQKRQNLHSAIKPLHSHSRILVKVPKTGIASCAAKVN